MVVASFFELLRQYFDVRSGDFPYNTRGDCRGPMTFPGTRGAWGVRLVSHHGMRDERAGLL